MEEENKSDQSKGGARKQKPESSLMQWESAACKDARKARAMEKRVTE
jgi:hypothetical protein